MVLFFRLAGCGIFALDAKSKDAGDIMHHFIYLGSCNFVVAHMLVLHDLLVEIIELGLVCSKLLLVGVFLARFMLIRHMNELDLAHEVVEILVLFICLLSRLELCVSVILLDSCAEFSCKFDDVHNCTP